jgi:hypothetical protein
MRPPVVKRHTAPRSGVSAGCPLGRASRRQPPVSCADGLAVRGQTARVCPHPFVRGDRHRRGDGRATPRGPRRPSNLAVPADRPRPRGGSPRSVRQCGPGGGEGQPTCAGCDGASTPEAERAATPRTGRRDTAPIGADAWPDAVAPGWPSRATTRLPSVARAAPGLLAPLPRAGEALRPSDRRVAVPQGIDRPRARVGVMRRGRVADRPCAGAARRVSVAAQGTVAVATRLHRGRGPPRRRGGWRGRRSAAHGQAGCLGAWCAGDASATRRVGASEVCGAGAGRAWRAARPAPHRPVGAGLRAGVRQVAAPRGGRVWRCRPGGRSCPAPARGRRASPPVRTGPPARPTCRGLRRRPRAPLEQALSPGDMARVPPSSSGGARSRPPGFQSRGTGSERAGRCPRRMGAAGCRLA